MSAEHAAPEFPVVRRGYDIREVDQFVVGIDTVWEARLNEAAARIKRLELELEEARRREEAVHLTLVTATKTKEELMQAAQRDLTDATGNAREQAEKILSEAKFEAFRLVTEANKDAEQIIARARDEVGDIERIEIPDADIDALRAEAKADADRIREAARADAERILAEAQADAESKVAAAQSEALKMLTEIKDESERMVEERDRELVRMREQFEQDHSNAIARIQTLQIVAADLEHRLQNVASSALGEIQAITTEIPTVQISPPQANAPTQQDAAYQEDPPLDSIPEAATAESQPEAAAASERPAPQEEQAKGSFYSRRSARLPRIGAEAASGALAAVSAMRAARAGLDDDIEIVVSEGDPEKDVAMQTA
jgi:cell division septum initiation protein DivIVA